MSGGFTIDGIYFPFVKKKDHKGNEHDKTVCKSMVLSTKFQEDEIIMPNASERAKKQIDFKFTCRGDVEPLFPKSDQKKNGTSIIFDYKSVSVQTGTKIDADYLTPTIPGLQCVAFELADSHFFNYIAGEWYMTISNPIKFFSQDYRLVEKDTIVKEIRALKHVHYYVHKNNLERLLNEIYPTVKGWDLSMSVPSDHSFLSKEEISKILKSFLVKRFPPIIVDGIDQTVDALKPDKIMENLKEKISNSFFKYVSLVPAWDTRNKFDAFVQGIMNWGGDKILKGKTEDDFKNELENTVGTGFLKNYQVKLETFRDIVGDSLDEYIKYHISGILNRLNVMQVDQDEIFKQLNINYEKINSGERQLTPSDLQAELVKQSFSRPGKYTLFSTLVKGAGVSLNDTDIEARVKRERSILEKKLTKAKQEIANIVEMKEKAEKGNDLNLLTTLETKLKNLTGTGKSNKVKNISRQIHALHDKNWFIMKDALHHAGVKAGNKKAVKNNIAMTAQETQEMISFFSSMKTPAIPVKKVDENSETLAYTPTISDIEAEIEITNLEIKDTPLAYYILGPPQSVDSLDSKKLFHGNKGVILDTFIQEKFNEHLSKSKYTWLFRWDRSVPTCFGRTYPPRQYKREGEIITWIEISLSLARQTSIYDIKKTILHEIAHAMTIDLPSTRKEGGHHQAWRDACEQIGLHNPSVNHAFKNWGKIGWVLRHKDTKKIYKTWYNKPRLKMYERPETLYFPNVSEFPTTKQNREHQIGKLELVRYEKKDYDSASYSIMKNSPYKNEYLLELEQKLAQMKAPIHNDISVLADIASYVGQNTDTKTVSFMHDMCSLYSADNAVGFEKMLSTSVKKLGQNDTEWLDGGIRPFHKYFEAMVIIYFTIKSFNTKRQDLIVAKTSTRYNSLQLALRYDMCLNNVPIKKLKEDTFTKLTKGTTLGKLYKSDTQSYKPDKSSDKMSSSTKQKSALDSWLKSYRLQRENTPGDGNCFFHAINKTMELNQDVKTLRNEIMATLRTIINTNYKVKPVGNSKSGDSDSNLWLWVKGERIMNSQHGPLGPVTDQETYLEYMGWDYSWADHAVVMASAVHFGCEIVVFNATIKKDGKFREPEAYQPPPELLTAAEKNLDGPPVYIVNENGKTHYQATSPIAGTANNPIILTTPFNPQSDLLSVIDIASKSKPHGFRNQGATTDCAMYAVNHLLGTTWTKEDFIKRDHEDKVTNWGTETIQKFLGQYKGKIDIVRQCLPEQKKIFRENMKDILNFKGFFGFIVHFPPDYHWTAMRKWNDGKKDIFTYMDSLKSGESVGDIAQMTSYMKGLKWDTLIIVFKTPDATRRFDEFTSDWGLDTGARIDLVNSDDSDDKTIDLVDPVNPDDGKPIDLVDSDVEIIDDKNELIKSYLSTFNEVFGENFVFENVIQRQRDELWKQIEEMFRRLNLSLVSMGREGNIKTFSLASKMKLLNNFAKPFLIKYVKSK